MSEKFEVPKKEKQKLDPQELLKKMTTIPETTGILRRTLSKETVETFLQIITSPEAVEADWMINCGDITEDQAEQYKIATGDYYTCLQKLTDLAIKISQDLKPRFIELVKNDIRGIKQGGLINFFKYLEALINIGAKLYSNENPHISNRGLPTQFYCQLQALIGADLIELSMDEKNEKSIRVEITNLIRELGDVYDETIGSTYPGIFFHIEKSNCIKAFEKKDNLASLDKLLNFTGSYSEEERLRVDKEIKSAFAVISKEAIYKKISLTTLNEKNPQIIAFHNGPGANETHGFLCVVRVNFSSEKIGFIPTGRDKEGDELYHYQNSPDVLDLTLNPKTGDLCFISSWSTAGIPIKDHVIPTDYCLALQNFVLNKLKEYLESKEPDIEDIFTYSPLELKEREEKISAREKQPEDPQNDLSQELSKDKYQAENKTERYAPFKEDQVTQEFAGSKFLLPKHFRIAILDRISGANSEAVIAALRRLLGKETKTEGSHLIFRSDRNNKTMPIPLHSQKDKNHIALPIILNNLKQWQYDPIELAMELGLKVPKRFISEQ